MYAKAAYVLEAKYSGLPFSVKRVLEVDDVTHQTRECPVCLKLTRKLLHKGETHRWY
jgi:hypothetical protein